MTDTGKLYRVLKPGVRQREGGALCPRRVGSLITVSDKGAAYLVSLGYIEPADGAPARAVTIAPEPPPAPVVTPPRVATPSERCPDHPRYLGRGEPHHGCSACERIHAASHAHEAHP